MLFFKIADAAGSCLAGVADFKLVHTHTQVSPNHLYEMSLTANTALAPHTRQVKV